jgi:hypothetical protein
MSVDWIEVNRTFPRPECEAGEVIPQQVERPELEWVRGACPRCGEALVSKCYYVDGRGYLVLWQCWAADCDYRRVL